MMFEVRLSPAARRDLEGAVPARIAPAIIEFLRGPLAADPRRVGKPLRHELAGAWVARRGGYRVIYTIEDRLVTVYVLRIAHRRDAYH